MKKYIVNDWVSFVVNPTKTKPLPTNGRKFKLKCANENNIDDNNAEI